ncbi:hypothetical protein Glove_520g3 [Diversispora epigaea]|uniref:Uncharacterized protein n=1 Tax=Diversispora epigaea TaxID=1348612 RepID=A0A397GEN8_9GLOM|nr:hypothetical protein Glove_520g3 [Diversispora epigaea]
MSRRKEFQVSLVSLGFLNADLHFGSFSQNWWESRQDNITDNGTSSLYPIRINMKTLVFLQNTPFIITVVQDHDRFLQRPGYICEAKDKKSEILDNPSAAITTLYQQIFQSKTRFSGPLIMGHDNIEISKQLLTGVTFRPFYFLNGKLWLFIFGIGISDEEQFHYTGTGFKSSFISTTGAEKKRTLFVQEINKKKFIIKIYQNFELISTHIDNSPDSVWQKVGMLQGYKGTDLFGISHPKFQSVIQKLRTPKCQPEEWHIMDKMEILWNYHLRKFTLASIQWHEFFLEWHSEQKTIIEFTTIKKLYPQNYTFKDREMRAWRAMLSHAGCTDITPYTKDISSYEFWTPSNDPTCDSKNILFLYESGFFLNNNIDIFWNSFYQALNANKKGYDGKRRILSIIAEKFSYNILMEKLKIAQNTIYEARKYARINGPGCMAMEKPIRKIKRITPEQEHQFNNFFQDKAHVIMSSYKTDAKTEDLGGLCATCSTYGYETFEDIINLIKEKISNIELQNTFSQRCNFLKRYLKKEYEEHLIVTDQEYQNRILYYLAHQTRKVYLNAQFNAALLALDENGAILVVDYKMKILSKTARETKQEFFGKKGWALYTILVYTKSNGDSEINIQAIDHWSTDMHDNGPHYHNSELMIILSKWFEWYGIQVKKWIFLEAGEAKMTVDLHHAQISLSIKRYIRIGGEIQEGNDITSAIKDIADILVANIESNCCKDNNKGKTIPGISNWSEWSWPSDGEHSGYIKARAVPNIGNWILFSPTQIQNFAKGEINQPLPQLSELTKPKSSWKIPIPHASGICSKRLPLQELTNELQNRGIDYGNQNKRQKLVEILDNELIKETLKNKENKGLRLMNLSMSNKAYNIRPLNNDEFPLSSGWASKEVQKYGKKGGGKRIKKRISAILEQYFLIGNVDKSNRMTAQDMWDLLMSKAQVGEIESSEIPKVTTIQGWITRYAAQLREKSAQTVLNEI